MPDEPSSHDLPPAYFLSLTLENVRCFGPEQTLDLPDDGKEYAQWTVLLGDNGTGKTTLLQVLTHLLPFDRHVPNKERSPVEGPIQTPRIPETHESRDYREILRSGRAEAK